MKLNDIHDYVKIMNNELNNLLRQKQKKIIRDISRAIEDFGPDDILNALNLPDQIKRKDRHLFKSPDMDFIEEIHHQKNYRLVRDCFVYGDDIEIEPFIYWNGLDFLRFKFSPEEMIIQYKNIFDEDSVIHSFKDANIIIVPAYNTLHDWAANHIYNNIIHKYDDLDF